MSDDNVVYLNGKHQVPTTESAVPRVCEVAAENFKDIVIIGYNHDNQVQMITTVNDPAEILWFFKAAEFGLMMGAADE